MANPSNVQESPETSEELGKVLEKIQEIIQESTDGDYLYRGEPKDYGKVTSNLYREVKESLEQAKVHADNFDMNSVQQEILKEVNEYNDEAKGTDELIIKSELQHYGGKTNLIDFTTDYLIALFFACDGHPEEDGRVILQKQGAIEKQIRKPKIPKHRVLAQKSIFVEPPKGYLESQLYGIVNMPKNLKQPMLDYLSKYHGISATKIYNDLHGFIKNQGIHHKAYIELYVGFALSYQRKYDEAIEHYSKAIKRKPNFAEAYNNRGTAHDDKKDYARAIKDFNKAIELNPNLAEAYNDRGIAHHHKKEHNHAIKDFNKAIELNPDYAEAYNNRGIAYADRKGYDHAILDYNQAIALNPNYANAYNNRGVAYADKKKKDYDLAIQDYDKAIALNPNDADAYNNRGNAYADIKDYARAIDDYSKAIERNPEDAEGYNNRGTAYADIKDYARDMQDYNKAIELNPDYTLVYYNRGITYLIQQAWDNAKTDLITTKEKGGDIVAFFQEDHQNIPTFEKKYNITLPPDLTALLS